MEGRFEELILDNARNQTIDLKEKIDSFDAVMDLPDTVKINFYKGKVPELSALAKLPRLSALWFRDKSSPASLAALRDFPSLVSLRLHNQFELLRNVDLPLRHISIDGSGLKDFSWLNPSDKLKWLSAGYNWNVIDDRAVLPALPALRILELLSRQLTTLSHLNLPKGIESLYAASNKKLKSLDGIEVCESLKQLDVFKTSLSSMANVPGDELLQLTASLTKIKTIEGWSAAKLIKANFHKTSLKNLNGFENLPSLETLNLSFTKITDLSPLKGLGNLRHLSLEGCEKIEDFSALKELSSLETLNVSKTSIKRAEIASLLEIPSLKKINLGHTEEGESDSIANDKVVRDAVHWKDCTVSPVHRAVEYLGLENANRIYPLEIMQRLGWINTLV